MNLTQKILKELISYSPDTGIAVWRKRDIKYFSHCKNPMSIHKMWNKRNAGQTVGSKHHSGYIGVSVFGIFYNLHRLVYLYMVGQWPEFTIDHINRVRDDNRWENLREVTHQCNVRNRCLQKTNKTGVSGVQENSKGFWTVFVHNGGKKIYIGSFNNFDTAVAARFGAEKTLNWDKANFKNECYMYLVNKNLLR